MNKVLFFLFFLLTNSFFAHGKKIKLPTLSVIQINHLLDLSVDTFYKETMSSKSKPKFTGNSLLKIQKSTKLLLNSSKILAPEIAVHFKKIFKALDVQISLLLKTSKKVYVKQVWKSLFIISRSFNVKTYFYGFCSKDRSMWIQKKKSKPVNPIGLSSCVNYI
ncbi:MAG: hypothetical protein HAW60_04710 [Bdellovibrionales bacterium]|nr:hypothetical protein [Bdellovibrionales bacterium]